MKPSVRRRLLLINRGVSDRRKTCQGEEFPRGLLQCPNDESRPVITSLPICTPLINTNGNLLSRIFIEGFKMEFHFGIAEPHEKTIFLAANQHEWTRIETIREQAKKAIGNRQQATGSHISHYLVPWPLA